MRRLRPAAALASALALLAAASPASAQMWAGDEEEYYPPPPSMELTPTRSLRRLTGLPVAQQLVQSDSVHEVIRGVEQLGRNGSQEALRSLLGALEQSGRAQTRDLRTRLVAVRVLAPHVAKENVRQYLVRELTAGVESSAQLQGLSALVRGSAGLALARSRHPQATDAISSLVGSSTAPAEAATRAIRAYPLEAVDLLLEPKRKSANDLALLLADQGDLRAIERLREMVAGADTLVRAPAAVGLARLGDGTVLKAVGEWVAPNHVDGSSRKLGSEDVRLLRAAAEVYLLLEPKKAVPVFAALLEKKPNVLDGVRLAMRVPTEALVAPLRNLALPVVAADQRRLVLQAIGRMGGKTAAKELEALWHGAPKPKDAKPAPAKDGKPDPAIDLSWGDRSAAALALARVGDDEAKAALERALKRPEVVGTKAKDENKQVQVVRAALVRALALRDAPGGLDDRLAEMVASQTGTVRAVGYFGAVARGLKSSKELLELACPAAFAEDAPKGAKPRPCLVGLVGAIARGALVRGTDALVPLQRVLEWEDRRRPASDVAASAIAIAAAPGLLAFAKGGEISTTRLAGWAENGGPIAPLAARALAARDSDVSRPRIRRLLAGSDPVVRAHVVLGLAVDDKKNAVSILADAYRFEDDASVRRAILRALSRRREPQRLATLTIARDLDPDDGARAVARAALAGRALDHAAGFALEVAWVEGAGAGAGELGARVVRSDGIALPLVSDPDGVMLVPGLPAGLGTVDLAPLPAEPGAK